MLLWTLPPRSTQDFIITNCQTNEYAAQFVTPTRATSTSGGHAPPFSGATGFGAFSTFLKANHTDGSYTPPAPAPAELPDAPCDSAATILLRQYWWVILVVVILIAGSCFGCALCCCKERLPCYKKGAVVQTQSVVQISSASAGDGGSKGPV